MTTRTGRLITDRPEWYAQQLARHWAQKTEQSEVAGATVLTFDSGFAVSMRPTQGALLLEVTVPQPQGADGFAEVVAEHLQRFGRRDEVQVLWDEA
jgi:hypothetical protein